MSKDDHDENGAVGLNEDIREIYLVGSISSNTVSGFIGAMRQLNRKKGPISVVISSTGGDVGAGFSIYDTIRLSRNKVIGQAVGECMSIAMLVFQACDVRLVSPETRAMLHNGSVEIGASINTMRPMVKEIEVLNNRYNEILAERSGLSLKKVEKMCNDETFLGAEEMLRLKLADGILVKPRVRRKKRLTY